MVANQKPLLLICVLEEWEPLEKTTRGTVLVEGKERRIKKEGVFPLSRREIYIHLSVPGKVETRETGRQDFIHPRFIISSVRLLSG